MLKAHTQTRFAAECGMGGSLVYVEEIVAPDPTLTVKAP